MLTQQLTREQVESYRENGFLHIPRLFSQEETDQMADHLEWLMEEWANREAGWTGPWRKVYMDEKTEKASKLVAMHDLHFYSDAWLRCVTNARLIQCMTQLLGENVELHHTTMHVKPPETGHPFPMHQDNAFYEHTDDRYVDVLMHLDDTRHENGEIRFLAGSHKAGYLPHITMTPEGGCTPHLPTDKYALEQTVPVPAHRGDVVVFNIFCVHGSHINQTPIARRLVRLGFRNVDNAQVRGQSFGRPGLMVAGRRHRHPGQQLFSTEMMINNPVAVVKEAVETVGVR
ncbi:MAG: phytanoyl-CoA dioxygenase family protein [Planctomycetota bacterium]|nr:phytanoyl-CoA dioxygenase family protein [Planctomycetota bacterium]